MSLPRTLSQDAVARAIRAALYDDVMEHGRFSLELVQALGEVRRLAKATERAAAREAELLARLAALESDAATAQEEDADKLADVLELLDDLGAPTTEDGRTLDPAERLGAYLDHQRSPRTERNLVLALSELGHLLAHR